MNYVMEFVFIVLGAPFVAQKKVKKKQVENGKTKLHLNC